MQATNTRKLQPRTSGTKGKDLHSNEYYVQVTEKMAKLKREVEDEVAAEMIDKIDRYTMLNLQKNYLETMHLSSNNFKSMQAMERKGEILQSKTLGISKKVMPGRIPGAHSNFAKFEGVTKYEYLNATTFNLLKKEFGEPST